MDDGRSQRWPKVLEGQELQVRKRILLFSLFLLVATFIWFLNALSKNYTTEIDYPMVYTDFPEGKVLVGEAPGHLELRINSIGYSILRYKILRKPVPISFKVSAFNLNWEQKSSMAFILTRYLNEQISSQLPSELQVLDIKPDTLYFHFSDSESRMVKVAPDLAYTMDKQFTLKNEIQMIPDSILVTGPVVIMDTLSQILTEHSDLGILSRDYRDNLRLKEEPDLEYELSRVECMIEMERFTELQLTIPIEVENVPDTIKLQTFPSGIKLTCRIGLSKYEHVKGHPFRALVDYSEIDERSEVLPVDVLNLPDYLLSYEYYPKTVEYLKSLK